MKKHFLTRMMTFVVLFLMSCTPLATPSSSVWPSPIYMRSTAAQEPTGYQETTVTLPPSTPVSSPAPSVTPSLIVTKEQLPSTNAATIIPPPPDIPLCTEASDASFTKNNGEITGAILYQKIENFRSLGLSKLDASTLKEEKEIIDQRQEVYVFGVSPDGKWLAYSPVVQGEDGHPVIDQPSMILINSAGERITKSLDMRPITKELGQNQIESFLHSFWINDHLISTMLSIRNADGSPSNGILSRIFDPFTGSWEFGEMAKVQELSARQSQEYGFSPDLTRFAYRTDIALELIELPTEKLITADNDLMTITDLTIRWAPDSSKVAYSGFASPENRSIHLMNRNGEIQKISTPFLTVSPHNLVWSPNSRYFALLSIYEGKTIYIYDTLENEFLLRCPLSDEYSTLVWSPKSTALAVSGYDGAPIQILKLSNKAVIDVHQSANIVGWSDFFR